MTTAAPGVQVRLTFSAKDLPSKDLLSKTDPFLVISSKAPNGSYTRIGTTEAIRNNENPVWTTGFTVEYRFETMQEYRLDVYDSDSDLSFQDLSKHDKIGSVDFHLANVLGSYHSTLEVLVKKPSGEVRSKARVYIRGDPLPQSRLKAYCSIRGDDFKRGTYLGSKDETILQLVKIRPDGSQFVVYASEIQWDSQNPRYPDFKVCMGQLTDGDLNKDFIIRIIRWKNASKQEILGEVKTTPANIAKTKDQVSKKLDIYEDGKKRGEVIIEQFNVVEEALFLDYVQAGIDFGVTIAIDATGSNGDPKTTSSLHHVDYSGKIPNGYIDGLRTVGNIVSQYSQKQWIAALGFGGFVSIDGAAPITSHCFPLTLQSAYPYCDGIEGVVGAYVNGFATGRIVLSGPTYLADIIKSATQSAMRPYTHDYQHYQVLTVFCDGAINDLDATVEAICAASVHPLSIIIIGIGNGGGDNWKSMEFLDSDGKLLKSKSGLIAKRDIVQFVPLSKYLSNLPELARVTLAEVPTQLVDFMRLHNIKPIVRQAPPPQQHQQSIPPQ